MVWVRINNRSCRIDFGRGNGSITGRNDHPRWGGDGRLTFLTGPRALLIPLEFRHS